MSMISSSSTLGSRTSVPSPKPAPQPTASDGTGLGLLIRKVEQRLLSLFSDGKLFGTVHTCIGQEWSAVAVAAALRDGDVIVSNHRCHGHYLAKTDDVEGLIAEIMGRTTGVCGGRGGSQHLCGDGFFSNGIQGGIVPIAAGLAWARKLRGDNSIAVVFIGDGTLGEGTVYETLNIAAKWELPLLIVLENNQYAQSTSQETTMAGEILARPAAFGIATAHGRTWDPDALAVIAASSVDHARRSGQPLFLRIDTYRLMAHSKGDDDRDPAEVQAFWDRDPLHRFATDRASAAKPLLDRIDARLDRAVALADAAPYPEPSFDDRSDAIVDPNFHAEPEWRPLPPESGDRVANRIHHALRSLLETDNRAVLIGEDIEGPYGGAFKVTKNLSLEFPGRVRNTPISESAIVGLGNGLALAGMRPVCEIMFGDFLALAADQWINHAAKFRYMYNDKVRVPLVVRTPMGGKRGYGATHSQCLEKHFLGVPGTFVLAVPHRGDPAELYQALFQDLDRPALVIEHKMLYPLATGGKAPDGFVWERDQFRFPTYRLRPMGTPDVTIVCYGGMLPDAEAAVVALFDDHEIIAEILCPTLIDPLRLPPIVESVARSGMLLTVEEGQGAAGFGAEVIARIHEEAPGLIRKARRLHAPRHPIPSCKPLETAELPGDRHIVSAVRELLGDG